MLNGRILVFIRHVPNYCLIYVLLRNTVSVLHNVLSCALTYATWISTGADGYMNSIPKVGN